MTEYSTNLMILLNDYFRIIFKLIVENLVNIDKKYFFGTISESVLKSILAMRAFKVKRKREVEHSSKAGPEEQQLTSKKVITQVFLKFLLDHRWI